MPKHTQPVAVEEYPTWCGISINRKCTGYVVLFRKEASSQERPDPAAEIYWDHIHYVVYVICK